MADKLVDDLKNALGDAYTIERELSGGGMSRVFVAKEHALGREVVIKVLPPDLAAGVNRDRFRREVQLAARLSHPYIVPLLHAGEHDELLWFTMPYIAGESLRTRLLRGPVPFAEAVRLLHDVVEALAYAHSRGVVHRDIKPGNILTDGHHALVTDFGVAKALNAALPTFGPGHTTSGMAIGTPAYMAPEQLAADPDADHRVDIYAVGLLAYEMLSGVSPFAAPSPTATMAAQLTRVPEPLQQLRPGIPAAFSDLVQRCLAKAPDDRPADAKAVLGDLDRIAGALAADAHRSISGDTPPHLRASSLPLLLAGFATVILVLGGFWWTQRASKQAAQRTDAALARIGGDTTDLAVPLPKTLTRQDSLNIAKALRDQLQQIDAQYPARGPARSRQTDSLPLVEQVKTLDSLTRVLLREQNIERESRITGGNTSATDAPTPPSGGAPTPPTVASGVPQIAATVAAPHRLVIVMPPPRADSTLRPLQRSIAADLARRAASLAGWSDVTIDSLPPSRDHPGANPMSDAAVLVFLGLQRQNDDSTVLRITVRSTDPSAGYGFRYLASPPVVHPDSIDAFRSTLRDATRLFSQLRRLPPGQPWTQDMGRGWTSGPHQGGFSVNRYSMPELDSMRKSLDSVHRYRPRHDSF